VKLHVVKHRKARRDLLLTFVYLGERNYEVAERFLKSVDKDLKQLAELPGMGALRHFTNPKLAGIRSWPISDFNNYLLFYRHTATTLEFLRLIHGAMDLEVILEE
jgi:toxin ParE1/3/4